MSVRPLRLGRPSDLAAVLALERSIPEAPHWSEEGYAKILGNQPVDALQRCLFVWADEPAIHGFAVGKTLDLGTEVESQLENVVVAESARRLGIGRSLCQAVLAWCGQNGSATVELEVRASSLGAMHLYEQLGFRTIGRRSAYYRAPVEDAILMELSLRGIS